MRNISDRGKIHDDNYFRKRLGVTGLGALKDEDGSRIEAIVVIELLAWLLLAPCGQAASTLYVSVYVTKYLSSLHPYLPFSVGYSS